MNIQPLNHPEWNEDVQPEMEDWASIIAYSWLSSHIFMFSLHLLPAKLLSEIIKKNFEAKQGFKSIMNRVWGKYTKEINKFFSLPLLDSVGKEIPKNERNFDENWEGKIISARQRFGRSRVLAIGSFRSCKKNKLKVNKNTDNTENTKIPGLSCKNLAHIRFLLKRIGNRLVKIERERINPTDIRQRGFFARQLAVDFDIATAYKGDVKDALEQMTTSYDIFKKAVKNMYTFITPDITVEQLKTVVYIFTQLFDKWKERSYGSGSWANRVQNDLITTRKIIAEKTKEVDVVVVEPDLSIASSARTIHPTVAEEITEDWEPTVEEEHGTRFTK